MLFFSCSYSKGNWRNFPVVSNPTVGERIWTVELRPDTTTIRSPGKERGFQKERVFPPNFYAEDRNEPISKERRATGSRNKGWYRVHGASPLFILQWTLASSRSSLESGARSTRKNSPSQTDFSRFLSAVKSGSPNCPFSNSPESRGNSRLPLTSNLLPQEFALY